MISESYLLSFLNTLLSGDESQKVFVHVGVGCIDGLLDQLFFKVDAAYNHLYHFHLLLLNCRFTTSFTTFLC